MPVLDAKGLVKSLGTRTLLQQVNVTIVRGEKVSVVGDNGAGKSTLAKILAGVAEPDQGEVNRRKGAQVAYLEQDPQFEPGSTAHEIAVSGLEIWLKVHNRYQEICTQLAGEVSPDAMMALLTEQEELSSRIELLGGWNRQDEAGRILKVLGIDNHEQDVATMSGGERRRVALARLLISQPDLAIFDEPTNHLDAETIEWLEDHLVNHFAGAVVLITHDRWLLNGVCTRTLEVADGQVHSYDGGWEEFLMGREERRAQEERTESNRQNFLRKEIEWLRRQPKARGTKQKARISRAEDAISSGPAKKGRELDLNLAEQRLGGTILEARHLDVSIGGKDLIHDLTFHLTKGSRVGIVGRSGAGKTTLLRTLLGEHPPAGGEIIRGKNTKIAYLDQMRGGLDEHESVYDAITGGRPSVNIGETEWSSYSYLQKFRFTGEMVRQKVAGLSGGERARVALAKLLLSTANVLVLDEPTNDLDVMTLGALEELILGLQGAALIVSHDRYFLDRVASSVLVLDGEGEAHHLQGGYSDYSAWRSARAKEKKSLPPAAARAKAAEPPTPAQPTKTSAAKNAGGKKLTYAEEIELKGLFDKVEKATKEVAQLEEKLADPTLYVERREEAVKLEAAVSKAKEQLEELEMRWLELEEKKSNS